MLFAHAMCAPQAIPKAFVDRRGGNMSRLEPVPTSVGAASGAAVASRENSGLAHHAQRTTYP